MASPHCLASLLTSLIPSPERLWVQLPEEHASRMSLLAKPCSTVRIFSGSAMTSAPRRAVGEEGESPVVTRLDESSVHVSASTGDPGLGVVLKKGRAIVPPEKREKPGAFTLVELLVVIAIIAVLAALVFPAARGFLDSSRVAKSTANLKSLSQGISLYTAENNGFLPYPSTTNRSVRSWWEVTYEAIYRKPAPPGFFIPHQTGTNLRGTVFYCPFVERSGEGTPVRSYGYNTYLKDGLDSQTASAPRIKLAKLTQPSKTLMLGTSKNTSAVGWGADPRETFSTRAGGKVLVIFVDGHADKLDKTNVPKSNQDIFWKGYK